MRRQLVTIHGAITALAMAEGTSVRFDKRVKSVSLVRDMIAMVILEARFGEENLLILGPAGDELARLGTTCGGGFISQFFEVENEIRVVEVTHHDDFQARFFIDTLTLERVGPWR